jgi:hypothetical protein
MQSQLRPEQMIALRCGPLWIVSAVLGRARDFNAAELEAMWNSVVDTASGSRGLSRDVLGALAADRPGALAQLAASRLPVATALLQLVTILDGVDAETARDVKGAFLAVGRGVARARSLGRHISEDDAKALLLVATLLDLPADDTGVTGAAVAPAWS